MEEVTPAIISEESFRAANAELDRPKVRTGRAKHEYLMRNHAYCAICGKPLVGHCLSRRFRYYQCSSARPCENHGKVCRARYVRADALEAKVWNEIRKVLSDPGAILTEIQSQLAEANDNTNMDSIDSEIQELEKRLGSYEQRRKNLLEALELGEFRKDEVLDRLNNLKCLRHADEAKLNDLFRMKGNLTSLANAEIKLGELYDRVIESLQSCTYELKRLALDALDIKVYASTEHVEIQGVIPLELLTTARTSGCLSSHAYKYLIPFAFSI